MRALSIAAFAVMVTAAHLAGNTAKSEVLFDNEHMRVVKTTLEPHQQAPLQEPGRNRVVIHLGGGEMTQTTPDGKAAKVEFKDREVRWMPAGTPHTRENAGSQPFQIVEIELKGTAQPQVTVPEIDPLKADPKHYKLELENDHVRILRVNFGPNEKGVLHTHMRNYIVTYMTPQAKGDRGQVNPHFGEGTVTHTENNPMDWPVERVAVELK
jgi:mannose-6-phosphate isomerase-like protein (cupin superfamily)